MDKIIEIDKLSCKAGSRYLLKNINWQLNRGENWFLFGLNGSGKTTLLSIIAGYRAYTAGNIHIFGEKYSEENVLALRRKIGFVSSSFFDKILTKESVLDIVLGGALGSIGLNEVVSNRDIIKAKYLLKKLNLKDKINYPYSWLSKGERQNILIARALIGETEILILDEPAGGLDIFAERTLTNLIKNLAQDSRMTLIYVTHHLNDILPEFNRGLLLKNGMIFAQGAREDLLNEKILSDFLKNR